MPVGDPLDTGLMALLVGKPSLWEPFLMRTNAVVLVMPRSSIARIDYLGFHMLVFHGLHSRDALLCGVYLLIEFQKHSFRCTFVGSWRARLAPCM